jgi:glycosyltransferase involved in cell wall biosynthesis
MEDKDYWSECQKVIETLPCNIRVQYHGTISHEQVYKAFSENNLFFFPTLGENYGHVILESLAAGCPVLISDQTPWRDLEKQHVGWDFPLDKPELFQNVLQKCVNMSNEDYLTLSSNTREYGIKAIQDNHVVIQNRTLFQHALNIMKNCR